MAAVVMAQPAALPARVGHDQTVAALDEEACAHLMALFDGDRAAQAAALAAVRGRVSELAFESAGCRVVQRAFEVADRDLAPELLSELAGRVREAARNPHANYVVQKVVTVASPAQIALIARELRGAGPSLARHRCGCRILCRLTEHSGPSDADVSALVDELLLEAERLIHHPFGHHVVQAIVEHGCPHHRSRVAAALQGQEDLERHALNPQSSHVVIAALSSCAEADAQALAVRLLEGGQDGVVALARNRFGAQVVRTLLRLPDPASQSALRLLWGAAPRLWPTRYGRLLLREVGIVPAEAPEAPAEACVELSEAGAAPRGNPKDRAEPGRRRRCAPEAAAAGA